MNLQHIFAMMKGEAQTLTRERTFILVLTLQLVIASFSSVIVVGLVSFYDPSSATNGVEIQVGISGDERDALVEAVDSTFNAEPVIYESQEGAINGVKNGEVMLSLHGSKQSNGQLFVTSYVPAEGFEKTLATTQTQKILTELQSDLRAERDSQTEHTEISLNQQGQANPYFAFTYTVLIPLLVFLPVFISGSLLVDSITQEKRENTLELLLTTPITESEYLFTKIMFYTIIVPVQAIIWFTVLYLNETELHNIPVILTFITLLALITTIIGTIVSILTNNRETAQFAYSSGILALVISALYLPENIVTTIAKITLDNLTIQTYSNIVILLITGLIGLFIIQKILQEKTLF